MPQAERMDIPHASFEGSGNAATPHASQTHESQRRSVGKTWPRTRRRHRREPSRDFSRRLFSYRVRRRGSLIRPGRIPIHFPESTDLQVRDDKGRVCPLGQFRSQATERSLRRVHRPRHPSTADAVAAVVASQQASISAAQRNRRRIAPRPFSAAPGANERWFSWRLWARRLVWR
jgi:hypothetical protein